MDREPGRATRRPSATGPRSRMPSGRLPRRTRSCLKACSGRRPTRRGRGDAPPAAIGGWLQRAGKHCAPERRSAAHRCPSAVMRRDARTTAVLGGVSRHDQDGTARPGSPGQEPWTRGRTAVVVAAPPVSGRHARKGGSEATDRLSSPGTGPFATPRPASSLPVPPRTPAAERIPSPRPSTRSRPARASPTAAARVTSDSVAPPRIGRSEHRLALLGDEDNDRHVRTRADRRFRPRRTAARAPDTPVARPDPSSCRRFRRPHRRALHPSAKRESMPGTTTSRPRTARRPDSRDIDPTRRTSGRVASTSGGPRIASTVGTSLAGNSVWNEYEVRAAPTRQGWAAHPIDPCPVDGRGGPRAPEPHDRPGLRQRRAGSIAQLTRARAEPASSRDARH